MSLRGHARIPGLLCSYITEACVGGSARWPWLTQGLADGTRSRHLCVTVQFIHFIPEALLMINGHLLGKLSHGPCNLRHILLLEHLTGPVGDAHP